MQHEKQEVFYWASFLSYESFKESISGMSKELQRTYEAIKKLEKDEGKWIFDMPGMQVLTNDETSKKWIKRQDIKNVLKIKTQNTIRDRIKALEKLGKVETFQNYKYAEQYVATSSTVLIMPLMRYELGVSFNFIKHYEKKIVNSYLIPYSHPSNSTTNSTEAMSLPHIIITNNNNGISNSNSISPNIGFEELMSILLDKLIAQINSTQKNQEK